jgi:outer membrane biosynthesis protein TonB
MDEMERPQMPADLNARLMKRMAEEQAKPQRRRLLWPWIAAACVAGVIAVYLTPPKASSPTPLQEARGIAEAENVVETPVDHVEQPAAQPVQVPVKRIVAKVEPKKVETPSVVPQEQPATTEQLLAQETKPVEQKVEQKSVTLTERDIPITRPENYKYTPEEIALMKKQANEAYMKWVELELEIAKNNLEQTAQNQ